MTAVAGILLRYKGVRARRSKLLIEHHPVTSCRSHTPVVSIIDDDPSVRQATDGLVRSLGYRVATFESAEDFLSSDLVADTGCLITDVQMPGMSGVELQTLLNARGTRVPIIFITAFPEEHIRRSVLAAGAIGFLSKPFNEAQLIEHLQTALESRPD